MSRFPKTRSKSKQPISKLSMAKLLEREEETTRRIFEIKKELIKIGDQRYNEERVASIEKQIEGIDSQIRLARKDVQQKPGFVANFLGTKEMKPEAKNQVERLTESRNRLTTTLSGIDRSALSNYRYYSHQLQESEEWLQKIRDKVGVLKAKEDKLNALKNKAAETVKAKREIGQTVKRKLLSNTHCPYCGDSLDGKEVHADHIYPIAKGGESRNDNMVFVCRPCNQKKGVLTLQKFIKEFDLDRTTIEKRLTELGKEF